MESTIDTDFEQVRDFDLGEWWNILYERFPLRGMLNVPKMFAVKLVSMPKMI